MEAVLERIDIIQGEQIIFKSINNIDLNKEEVIGRKIPNHFNNYIESLIEFINSNNRIRYYKPRSQSTQVISNIKSIIESTQKEVPIAEFITKNNFEISERLLREEIKKQEHINRLGNDIKKGSIIQVLLKDGETYKYLIAKVDFAEWIDNDDFATKIGFSAKAKNIGKTCLFEIHDTGTLFVDSAKIYLDNEAKYWANDFLELKEMLSDEVNTDIVFKEVERVFKDKIKKKSLSDYTVLRNSLIGKLKTSNHIDYNLMIKDLIDNYTPDDKDKLTKEVMNDVKEKLEKLPQSKSFDLQFNPVPSAIKAKIRSKYKVSPGIEIKVDDFIKDIKSVISSLEDSDGERFLKIKTTDKSTFDAFVNEDTFK